jgi:hypothetical protein
MVPFLLHVSVPSYLLCPLPERSSATLILHRKTPVPFFLFKESLLVFPGFCVKDSVESSPSTYCFMSQLLNVLSPSVFLEDTDVGLLCFPAPGGS